MVVAIETITLDETVAFLASTDEERKRLRFKDALTQESGSDLALAVVELIGCGVPLTAAGYGRR
jgi:hypothetical protein